MNTTYCPHCRGLVSIQAVSCPHCGAPVQELLRRQRGSFENGCALVVGVVLLLALAWYASRDRRPRVAESPTASTSTADAQRYDPNSPTLLIAALKSVGLQEDPGGKGWHRSDFDGIWNAVVRKRFGQNEVSCLIESNRSDAVQRVELEAEFHHPGVFEREILTQFAQALAAVYPNAPRELAEAIAAQREWKGESWHLTREPYKNRGYGLMLRRR